MSTLDDVRQAAVGAMSRFLAHAQIELPSAATLADISRELTRAKQRQGRAVLMKKLQLYETALAKLEEALHEAIRRTRMKGGSAQEERHAWIAHLRLLARLEPIAQKLPDGGVVPPLEPRLTERTAGMRVRAIELMLRSLVIESYRTQEALEARLRSRFDAATVDKWRATADPGDILSGMGFSDLASFFVSRDEFGRYDPLFAQTGFLTLLRDHRKTLQDFLDTIRGIRNALAHHKRITPLQLTLLELYYEEIATPLSAAYERGDTQVNPEEFLDVSDEDLHAFTSRLAEDLREVEGDLVEVKSSLAATRQTVSVLEGSLLFLFGSGIWFIAVIVLAMVFVPADPTDMEALSRAGSRSMRGMAIACVIFGLGLLRIVYNVTLARRGGAGRLAAFVTGPGARWATLAFMAGAVLYYVLPIPGCLGLDLQCLTPKNLSSMETAPILASLQLNEAGLQRYLDDNGDPNLAPYGSSLLTNVIMAVDPRGTAPQAWEDRRLRCSKLLIARGARVSSRELELARSMKRQQLVPLLEAAASRTSALPTPP